jgi:isoleucyl-tRNA synthetase
MWKSSPIEPLSFSTDELMSRPYQVLSTLYHLHLYFKQNSEYDKFDETKTIQWAQEKNLLQSPDIWLLSKLQKLIQRSNEFNDKCKFHEAAKALEDFIINSLSQIYIPITRGELWEEDESKKDRRFAIYSVLHEILRTLDILLHPICPFTTEYLYQTTFAKNQSILLDSWPNVNESLISPEIEESFDLLKEAVSVSSAARMKGKLKRRWPLAEAIITVKPGQKRKLETLSDLLKNQLNVENVKIIELENKVGLKHIIELKNANLPIEPKTDLNRKTVAPKVKKDLQQLSEQVFQTDPYNICTSLVNDGSIPFTISNSTYQLNENDFEYSYNSSKGYCFAERDNYPVFLSSTRNSEMMARGLIKDLARRLQTLRKERGYNPTDILSKASILDLDSESVEMIKAKKDELAFLVRVKEVNFEESCKSYKDDDIDGQKIRISVE